MNYKTTNLDLDINNYKLNDLLKLFNITINFTEDDLKNIKKKVLFMHPDKSGFDKSIFLFYTTAYKLLVNIYNNNNQLNNKLNSSVEYKPYEPSNIDEENKQLLDNITKKYPKYFNNWFNKQFEKNNLTDVNQDGYNDWLKNTPIQTHNDVDTIDEIHKSININRKNITTISKYDGFHNSVHTFGNTGTLITEKDANFSSGLFSGNFQYDDLKQAYSETIIPVYLEESNLTYEDLIKNRDTQNLTPISNEKGIEQLNKINKDMDVAYMQQNYELLKQEELAKKKNIDFLNNLKLLKNNFFK